MTHYLTRLQKIIKENWDHPALRDYNGVSVSFGELAAELDRCHKYFKDNNIKQGDRIAICAHNQVRWAVAFLAVNTYGAVAVPILDNFSNDGIRNLLRHSGSILLFTDNDSLKGEVPALILGEFFDKFEIPSGFGPDSVHFGIDNDKELAVINYTSGSTGDPKGVMVRYECLSANIEFGHKRIPSYSGDNILSILPMGHMFGLVFELLYPLCGGTTVWYLGKAPSTTLLVSAMKEVRPYLVIAVPMVFEKIFKTRIKPALEKNSVRFLLGIPLIRNLIFRKMRKSIDSSFGGRIRSYIIGGAAFNPETEAFFKRIGFHFTVGYGMTEAAPLICYEDWQDFVPRSCGKPIDSVEVRIDSADGEHVPGEIQIRGVSVFSGYYNNPAATEEAFTDDGWFKTGDLGTMDRDGNLFIRGRSKCMLLTSNGQNVYPEEMESVLNNLPQVAESLVVCRKGQLVALVVPNTDCPGDESTASAILAGANLKLPKFCRLSKVEFNAAPFEKTPKLSIKRFLYK